jgi:hypothetical protein
MKRFPLVMLVWFFAEFPRLSKALVILSAVAILVGMYLSVVRP